MMFNLVNVNLVNFVNLKRNIKRSNEFLVLKRKMVRQIFGTAAAAGYARGPFMLNQNIYSTNRNLYHFPPQRSPALGNTRNSSYSLISSEHACLDKKPHVARSEDEKVVSEQRIVTNEETGESKTFLSELFLVKKFEGVEYIQLLNFSSQSRSIYDPRIGYENNDLISEFENAGGENKPQYVKLFWYPLALWKKSIFAQTFKIKSAFIEKLVQTYIKEKHGYIHDYNFHQDPEYVNFLEDIKKRTNEIK